MKIGFIGFGEAAYELSCGLMGEGVQDIVAYDPMWNHKSFEKLISQRAKNAKVKLLSTPETVLEKVEVVFVAVPANKALEVSETLKNHLNKGTIYVDVSASTPTTKEKINAQIKEKDVLFVDAAMMGPLPIYKHKVPMLVSGNGSNDFIDTMKPYSMVIKKVSDNPGEASAVKLIRSIFMKGMAALFFELLEAANHYNVDKLVLESISENMNATSFEETLNRLVTSSSIHALRRSIELEGSIEMLKQADLDSLMATAAKEKLFEVSQLNLKEKFEGKTPQHWLSVIEACKVN